MANPVIEPITLPWKRPEKGVSAAELGASFRVEQRDDGWHCTVKVGRHAEVLASGLRRLRDAQCRAEAHAAKMPEVAAALAQQAKESKERPRSKAPTPAAHVEALKFERVSDGCICGKIDGGTWVADPKGNVSVPTGTDPALAQQICRIAERHYTTLLAKPSASKPATRATPKATPPTVAKPAKPAKPARPAKPTAAAKPAKSAAKPAKPAAKSAKPTPAAKPAKSKAKAAKPKTTTKPTPAAAAKPETVAKTKQGKAAAKKTAKVATPKVPTPRGRKRGKASAVTEEKTPEPTPPAKEKKMSKKAAKPPKNATADASCGCVTWTSLEGKIRGAAKHGTFAVEPEGKRHALYFYDADGQSRHLDSGEPAKLRKLAEEMAARGQPAPRATTAGNDDAALLRAFLGDDA